MVCVVSRVICFSLAISGGSCWRRLIGGGAAVVRGVFGAGLALALGAQWGGFSFWFSGVFC